MISAHQTTTKHQETASFMLKYSVLLSYHFSGREAVWEFPQSHSQRDDKPRWVRWLQTAPALQLRARDRSRRSSRRRSRGWWSEEEKEGQLAKQIWTLLHHGREAFRASSFPDSTRLLRGQHLLHRLPVLLLLILDTLRPAGLSLQQWIRSGSWGGRRRRRREGAWGHGCQQWDSKIPVTPQEWESAKQQRLHNHWARWGGHSQWTHQTQKCFTIVTVFKHLDTKEHTKEKLSHILDFGNYLHSFAVAKSQK